MDKKIGTIIAPISSSYFAPPASVPNVFACCTISICECTQYAFSDQKAKSSMLIVLKSK